MKGWGWFIIDFCNDGQIATILVTITQTFKEQTITDSVTHTHTPCFIVRSNHELGWRNTSQSWPLARERNWGYWVWPKTNHSISETITTVVHEQSRSMKLILDIQEKPGYNQQKLLQFHLQSNGILKGRKHDNWPTQDDPKIDVDIPRSWTTKIAKI